MIGVLGARGFLGQHVVKALAEGGHRVLAVARSFEGATAFDGLDDVERVELDVWDKAGIERILPFSETVVQLVGNTSPATGGRSLAADVREHVMPHVEFLDQCVSAGVRRVIFASSGGTVYGAAAGTDGAITELSPTHPISSHGLSKLMIERTLALHGHLHGLEYVILRIANAYGPLQTAHRGQGLIPAVLDRYRNGQPVTVFGDGSTIRDYVYGDDVAAAVRLAAELDGSPQLVVNIGTGIGSSVADIIGKIESIAGIRFEVDHRPARPVDVPASVLDVTLARQELGWTPAVDLCAGLTRTLRAHGLVR